MHNNETLGEAFWTEEIRGKLTAQLVSEYDMSDRTSGTVEERVVQVHLPAPMGTCVPLTGGISKTGGVCSENKTR